MATLSCDLLEILLGGRVGIANLQKEALFADGLAVEFLDNLLADVAGLKTVER